ncbi:MAG TPA: hypothetical protein VN845_01070, partial [Solirubrobacteraceae bacterium]|nr:hypothetical protein [Solirubrobacteraceae bacterium]
MSIRTRLLSRLAPQDERAAEPAPERTGEHADAGSRARGRRTVPAILAIPAGALLLWVIAGVGFVNYDTLYGLVWGQQ